jgi:integrase
LDEGGVARQAHCGPTCIYKFPNRLSLRRNTNKKARNRILTDDEIRDIWVVPGRFADYVKVLLLTAQRRTKVSQMRWDG